MRFRIFVGLLVALLVAYVAFWFVLADEAEERVVAAIDAQRMAGAAIAYDELDVGGFPYRLEFTVRNLDMARDEENGVSWRLTSPELAVVVQPWKLSHAILFAQDLTLAVSQLSPATTITTRNLRASLVTDKAQRPLRVAMEADRLMAYGEDTGNQELAVDHVGFHWRRPEDSAVSALAGAADDDGRVLEPMTSEWAIKGEKLTHPAFGESPYGDVIQKFSATVAVRGTIADGFDRATLASWRDQGGTLELEHLILLWGGLDLIVDGSITLDERYRPLGALTAEVKGYEPVIDHLQASGEIDSDEAETVKSTLSAIAGDDRNGRLTIPIAMQSGRLFIGPLPVANLPPVAEE